MRQLLVILLAVLAVTVCDGRRERTTIKGHMSAKTAQSVVNREWEDSVTAPDRIASLIRLSGYDKPISASREAMHVSNLSDSLKVVGIVLAVEYLDTKGRELHRRTVTLYDIIDPGHTELVTFPTWDVQRSFYYILSAKPRRQATPYDIRCTPTCVFVEPVKP